MIPITFPGGSVGVKVWQDTNGDGVQDAGEAGVSGVTVLLKQGATTVATNITDASGINRFTNVAPGTYTVVIQKPSGSSFTAPGQGGDATLDSKVTDVASGSTTAFTLTSGQSITTIGAGLTQGVGFVAGDKLGEIRPMGISRVSEYWIMSGFFFI
jgi:hypothetical protein